MWCYLGFLSLAFSVFPSITEGSDGLTTIFFKDLCTFSWTSYTRTIYLGPTVREYNSSAILKAKDFGFYPTEVSCTVLIVPPPGYGVVAAMRSIDFRPNCVDNLTISDSMKYNTTLCGRKSYSEEKMSIFSSSNLTVIFKTGSFSEGSIAFHDGFQLTVTAYKNWPCSSRFEFECSNLRCISAELICDGHNHCGDRSDQSRCGIKSVGGIVGLMFGFIFLSIAVVSGIVYYRRKYKNRTVGTTVHLDPQPPQHRVYGATYEPYGHLYQPVQVPHIPPVQMPYPPPQQQSYAPLQQQGISPTAPEAFITREQQALQR